MENATNRRTRAANRLAALRAAAPEHRWQAYDSWLEVATGAEVRRAWRSWMGPFPGWALPR